MGLYDRFGYHPALLDEGAELLKHLRVIEMAGGESGGE